MPACAAPGRRIMATASVLGGTFSLAHLLLMVDMEESELVEELDHLVLTGYITEVQGGGGEMLQFAHTGSREALYDSLSMVKRRFLHRRAAEALVRLNKEDLDPVVFSVADHYLLSRERELAVKYALKAGGLALRTLGTDKAVAYYRRAIAALDVVSTEPVLIRIEDENGYED